MTRLRVVDLPAHALALFVILICTVEASAQAGAGAERYEVTISPPKRPGSEAAPEGGAPAAPVEGAAVADPANAASVDPARAPSAAAGAPDIGVAATAPVPAALPAPAPAVPAGPPRTLQVAAFRQQERAETLRDELAGSFPDVAILEIQSGGEPLYRVNVGRLPKGAELDALKKRLAAAGHPSFDVPAPARPAGD